VNKVYIPTTLISASSSTSSEKPLATGMWGQDESPIEPESIVRVPFGGGLNVTWFGILGPEVWVGPMRESLPIPPFPAFSTATVIRTREMTGTG